MNLDKKGTLKLLGVIFASILFFAAINNFSVVWGVIKNVLSVLSPLFIGLALAFILNLPLRFFETKVFRKLTYSQNKVWKKLKRPICLTLSVVLSLAVVSVLLVIIIPQIIDAVKAFIVELPKYMDAVMGWADGMIDKYDLPIESISSYLNWADISAKLLEIFNNNQETIVNTTKDIIMGLGTAIFNMIFGFVFAIYILASKESLGRTSRRLVYSVLPSDKAKSLLKVSSMSNKAFSGFVVGQLLEAVLVGVLCVTGMLILKMPYAVLVSAIIAITQLIPIFGPIIGTVIGAFVILIVSPMQAIWFVVFILALQQVESNVIYPKIMGKTVGLPGLWVLVSVTTFGGLWGVVGIIFSVPVCSVVYALFDSWLSKRLIERNIASHHYEEEHKPHHDHSFFKFRKKKKAAEEATEEAAEESSAASKE